MSIRPHSKIDTIEMARRAAAEIKDLRRTIERLQPKAHAYDTLCQVLGLLPQRGETMGEDVAWMLEKRAVELEELIKLEEARSKTQGPDET